MKKLILILLESFAFSSLSNAIPKEEEPTLKSINEKCKGKDSKFLEYVPKWPSLDHLCSIGGLRITLN